MILNYHPAMRTVNLACQYELAQLLRSSPQTSKNPRFVPELLPVFHELPTNLQAKLPYLTVIPLPHSPQVRYVTAKPDAYEFFVPPDPDEIHRLIREFQSNLDKNLAIIEYPTQIRETTLKQLSEMTLIDGVLFTTEELRDYANRLTYLTQPVEDAFFVKPPASSSEPERETIEIDASAIRKMTGYEPVPWQKRILQDTSPFIFLVGSRQI